MSNINQVEISGQICAAPAPVPLEDPEKAKPKPRQPTSLQGLLRFAMETTKMEDAPNKSQLMPLDEERKQFLENALKSMTIDVIQVLKKHIEVLQKANEIPAEADISAQEEALEGILDYIDNIDIANDFHKIGGFMVLFPCLKSAHPKIRAGGCELIAVLCQNNPYCQRVVLENEFLPFLFNLLDTDKSGDVQAKAMYAISGIVRENMDGYNQLIQYNGLAILQKALLKKNEKVIIKAVFFLDCLCRSSQDDFKSRLVFLGFVPILISVLNQERISYHEHILSLLVTLVEENPTAIKECQNPNHNLTELLQNYLQKIANNEEKNIEEEVYCKRLLHCIKLNY